MTQVSFKGDDAFTGSGSRWPLWYISTPCWQNWWIVHKYTLLAQLVNSKYDNVYYSGNDSALELWIFWTHLSEFRQTRGWKLWKKEFIIPPCEFMNTYKDQLSIADCSNRISRKQNIGRTVPIILHTSNSSIVLNGIRFLMLPCSIFAPASSCVVNWLRSGLNG
jgi:hypothetical protein